MMMLNIFLFIILCTTVLGPILVFITLFEKFKENRLLLEEINSKLNKLSDNIK